MNKTSKTILVSISSLLLIAAVAQAQSLNPAQQASVDKRLACLKQRIAKRMLKFDTNQDGKVDRSERKAAFAARKQAMLAKYDLDRDGVLSKSERAAKRKDRINQRFSKLDTNGDGQISVDEAAQSWSARTLVQEARHRQQRYAEPS